jgi:hypothetical protein
MVVCNEGNLETKRRRKCVQSGAGEAGGWVSITEEKRKHIENNGRRAD